MTTTRHLKNESGVATILMVVAGLIVVALVGMSFIIGQQNKHQGSAVTVNAEQAQSNAEAGYRYAVKCLEGNDAACACNVDVGSNGCLDWTNMQDFLPKVFGPGNFTVRFNNNANCSIGISSLGTVNNTSRTINNGITRDFIGGALVPVTVANTQSLQGNPVGVPIAVLNPQIEPDDPIAGGTITMASYVVPAGSDLVLVVAAGAEDGTPAVNGSTRPVSATFNGTPMNLVDRQHVQSDGGGTPFEAGLGMFWLPVTAGASGPIVVTYTNTSVNEGAIMAYTLSNALGPPQEFVSVTDNTNPPNTILGNFAGVLSAGSMIATAGYQGNNSAISASGATHVLDDDSLVAGIPNSSRGAIGHRPVPTASTPTGIGWSAGFNRMVLIMASFPPAVPPNTVQMNYTVPPGSDQTLVVAAGAEGGNGTTPPTTATFGGNPVNTIATPVATDSYQAGLGMYWLPVTAGDTGTISVSFTGNVDDLSLYAYTLNNTTQTGPQLADVISVAEPANLPLLVRSFTNNLPAGSMVATTGYQGNSNALIPVSDAGTHVVDAAETDGSSAGILGSMPIPLASTPTNVGFSPTNPPFNRMVMVLAPFPPAGGGGPCLP